MAKSARASSKKANRTKLRARVFGPVEQARAERVHAKLLETIQQPKPEKTEMDTTDDANTADEATKDESPKDMDVDGAAATAQTSKSQERKDKEKNREKSQTKKLLSRHPRNKVSFPTSRGKGALKPFTGGRSGGRVSKRRT